MSTQNLLQPSESEMNRIDDSNTPSDAAFIKDVIAQNLQEGSDIESNDSHYIRQVESKNAQTVTYKRRHRPAFQIFLDFLLTSVSLLSTILWVVSLRWNWYEKSNAG